MPRWLRQVQLVLSCLAIGIFAGILIAIWLGPTLFTPGVGLLIFTFVFLPTVVPTVVIEVIIRIHRMSKRDNHRLQLTGGARE